MSGAPGGQIAEAALVQAMWSYAAMVLYPAQALKKAGLYAGTRSGQIPERVERPGLGPLFSKRFSRPVLLSTKTEHDHLVEEFDRMGEVYEAYVQPFSRPIFDEALREMRRFLAPDARVMDAGCGTGLELRRIASEIPTGEVVGVDLAAGMVNAAYRSARAHGLDNCAFFQADVCALPSVFHGRFDLIYNSLAHHHYPDPPAAAGAICQCLRPGGIYCVIDPGPQWYNRVSAPMARWADPGWIGFHTPEQFGELFRAAGLARTGWIDLLPGFGLAIGQKAMDG